MVTPLTLGLLNGQLVLLPVGVSLPVGRVFAVPDMFLDNCICC